MAKIIDFAKYKEENPQVDELFVRHNEIKIVTYHQWQMLIWLNSTKKNRSKRYFCIKEYDSQESIEVTKEEAKKIILDGISRISPLKDEIWEKIEPEIMQKKRKFQYVLLKKGKMLKESPVYKIVK